MIWLEIPLLSGIESSPIEEHMSFKNLLLAFQLYIHFLFIVGIFWIPINQAIISVVICQIIFVGACGTLFMHRVASHKVVLPSYVESFLLILSWIGVSGSAIAWAGTHRKHHRYTDTDKDPHSPIHGGALRTYWYSSGGEDIVRYVPDLLRKRLYVFQHKYYFRLIVCYHLIVALMLPFTWYWTLCIVPPFLMWFSGSLINVLCHDSHGPRNINLLGYLCAGEGWHQNHHLNPNSASFGHSGDWGYQLYKLLSWNPTK